MIQRDQQPLNYFNWHKKAESIDDQLSVSDEEFPLCDFEDAQLELATDPHEQIQVNEIKEFESQTKAK